MIRLWPNLSLRLPRRRYLAIRAAFIGVFLCCSIAWLDSAGRVRYLDYTYLHHGWKFLYVEARQGDLELTWRNQEFDECSFGLLDHNWIRGEHLLDSFRLWPETRRSQHLYCGLGFSWSWDSASVSVPFWLLLASVAGASELHACLARRKRPPAGGFPVVQISS